MSFWENLAIMGTMATILGVFLTIYGILNNRVMRAAVESIRDLIREFRQETVELLDRIERGQEELRREAAELRREVAETRREVAEARREAAEARREMAEAIKYVASLIVSESERTRQAIRETP
jgi:F0F1-type ATP synthase membrane subunit b/b'